MNNIIIFSGTTEGRILSDLLAKAFIRHIVCVASDYGMIVMEENEYADIRVGRLDIDQMKQLFLAECDKDSVIVDATHPYATIVTDNIRLAAEECGLNIIRVVRQKSDMDGYIYNSMSEVASRISRILDETNENVMLTTGSKDLNIICEGLNSEQKKKVYVRILPALESINICLDNDIEPGHIIAMQGPFSEEMNVALFKQYDIRHLVTKESGSAGGFEDKINAAKQLGIQCHIVSRKDEEGVPVAKAYELITGNIPENDSSVFNDLSRKITLIGRGMGTESTLTKEAIYAIKQADAVFGAQRLISDIKCERKYEMYRAEDIIPVLNGDSSIKRAVVVFSGDSGFFSGATNMHNKLKDFATVEILSGISSVAYFASRLNISYSDAYIDSVHGRNEAFDINRVANNIIFNKKSFVLLSSSDDICNLAKKVDRLSHEYEIKESINVVVGRNLSYDDELIDTITMKQAMTCQYDGVLIAFFDNPEAPRKPLMNVLCDDAFIRDKVPMTKECIRHESIAALKLRQHDIVYDIGGGTGSVAIEIARLDASVKVYTIEKKPEAARLIEKNISLHGTDNVQLIEGEAPQVLNELPPADAVFIGGSSGYMADILKTVSSKKSGVRVVINAVSFETINEVNSLLNSIGAKDIKAMQIAVTDIKEIGKYHMMQANNPVMIYSFTML